MNIALPKCTNNTMDVVKLDHKITIPEFYKGRNIFITGATGFIGKALLEKLLRSCPDIGNIYILVRAKKGLEIKKRLETLLDDKLFDTLKSTHPDQLLKILPLQGDCSQLSLGLNATDYKLLINSVSVIYHVAANVRFDDSLRHAILLNIRGTREVANVALQMSNLDVLVHVSTTFCNCVVGREIEEKLYPPPTDWRQAIETAEADNKLLEVLTSKYLGSYPNTYTFTKALSEHVIKDLCEGKVKTVIFRPSVVTSSLKDPVAGWIGNFNGPIGLLVASAKGLLRCGYQNPDIDGNYVPVDVTVRALVAASWDTAQKSHADQVDVINCSSGYNKWINLGEVIDLGRDTVENFPVNHCIWVPKGGISKCIYYAYFCTIFFHLLPAAFLDLILLAMRKQPMLVKLQTKIFNVSVQLRYFTFQEWIFCNNNFLALDEKLLDEDKPNWEFEFRSENVKLYLKNSLVGVKKYLLNEDEDVLPQARKHYKRMYWLDKFTMFILYGSIVLLIIYSEIISKSFNKFINSYTYYFDGKDV